MVQETGPYVERPATQELLRDAAYQQPDRYCDIIMKGGITSGVAYPLAVCELARRYQLKSIGGASAGAIAAAGAAAAELGRQRLRQGPPADPGAVEDADMPATNGEGQPRWRQGFAGLAQLPAWIGGEGHLLSLFQPQGTTKSLFNLLIAGLGQDRGRTWRIAKAAIREFPGAAMLGLVPGAVLLMSAVVAGGLHLLWGLVCALILLVVGPIITVGLAVYRVLAVAVPANRFGICSGLDGERRGGAVPLTAWLADYLDALAGKPPNGAPLTFGELWGGPGVKSEGRNVDLQMMTTCLTLGRPFRLPFESQRFMFRASDFRALFPERVVAWMIEHPGKFGAVDGGAAGAEPGGSGGGDSRLPAGFHPMPSAADLPVVVAARMSLSFPVLFSAVPLYAVDFSRPAPAGGDRVPEPCWFSDGGITSNLPVHFFDQPLPRWPTFAINLRSLEVGVVSSPDERENVYFPRGNVGGQLEGWTRFGPPAPGAHGGLIPSVGPFAGFVNAIIDTMQNWVDNAQIRQAGYRDRTIHIKLASTEGGLNLNMPPKVTDVLGERGRIAGVMLRERFAAPPASLSAPSWDNHRWIRYRTAMASLEAMLEALVRGVEPLPPDRSYDALIARGNDEAPRSYRWKRAAQRLFAQERTAELLKLARVWCARDRRGSFAEGAPNPRGELRQVPRL